MESSGFSLYNIMSSADSDIFTFSFPIWMPFISFACLIAMARTFDIVLNKSGDSWYHCLVSDLRGKAFSFSPLSMMLAVGLSYINIMLRYIPSVSNSVFIMKEC